ncbi:hypothetical protein U9M48_010509 [Paspalum notatum var. saurae]|uniref:BHLH domain-containing protein n=1 Tax=Paspalum notatum var. saurae TaxID=547442 RepID=A0AAQ3STR9_PASNO
MQMDSYFYAGCFHDESPFYPHAAAPPSPELPFGLIAEPEQPFAAAQALSPTAFQDQDYCMGAGPELPPPPPQAVGAGAPSHMNILQQDHAMETEEEPRRRQPAGAVESSRGFRHMMRERQRREKLSQSYADLHALVAARSRGDKNSIVQSAAIYIRELRGAREQLRRRNEELKARILGHDAGQQCVKLQFEVDDPASGVDSMIGALRRLRAMGVRARGIRSDMAERRLRTEMNVETTIAAAEVEKAVEEALLQEVERKQQQPGAATASGAAAEEFPGTSNSGRGWGPQASSHVQNVF